LCHYICDVSGAEAADMDAEDDAWRVRQVLAGDLQAFGALYDRYAGLIRALCLHETGHDFHAAQDLCQEVFLRGYRNLAALKDPGQFAGWLVGIARLAGREWRGSRYRERRRLNSDAAEQTLDAPDGASPGDVDGILALIGELPEPERLALHLFYLQENSVEVARQVLNLSRSGFYRLLERAEEHLRQKVGIGREVRE
jgi:RNA polymerase sigma-70 factor, ECF subfamily